MDHIKSLYYIKKRTAIEIQKKVDEAFYKSRKFCYGRNFESKRNRNMAKVLRAQRANLETQKNVTELYRLQT